MSEFCYLRFRASSGNTKWVSINASDEFTFFLGLAVIGNLKSSLRGFKIADYMILNFRFGWMLF